MNEGTFNEILAEICDEEFTENGVIPPFEPSLHHKLVMKRIFASFKRNAHEYLHLAVPHEPPANRVNMRLERRLAIAIAIIVCAVLIIAGAMNVDFSKRFQMAEHSRYTLLSVVETGGCPAVIRDQYQLQDVPEGFEIVRNERLPEFGIIDILFENKSTNQYIEFRQRTKGRFEGNFDSENHTIDEININGSCGLSHESSENRMNSRPAWSSVVWDNGDYILNINSNLPKNDIINLAKTTKISKN